VKARFAGDIEYDASETAVYPLTPSQTATTMDVTTAPPATVDAGSSFAFEGNLIEETSLVGIVGRTVALYVDAEVQTPSTTTGVGGAWAFDVTLPAGTHSVYALFPGDATYLGCAKKLSTRGPLLAAAGVLALVGIACLKR